MWSVDTATDLMVALLSASLTMELTERRRWSRDEFFRDRLLLTLQRALLVDEPPTKPKKG